MKKDWDFIAWQLSLPIDTKADIRGPCLHLGMSISGLHGYINDKLRQEAHHILV